MRTRYTKLNSHKLYYEDLCFQLQQAAEKALKGLLIYYGLEPEFTHNIAILLNELKKFTEIPENIKEAAQLTNFAVQTRYPGEYDEITKEEYEKSITIAAVCLNWVETKIKESEENKHVSAMKIKTKGFKFDRNEANER